MVSESKRNFNAILLFGRNGKAASYSRKTGPRAMQSWVFVPWFLLAHKHTIQEEYQSLLSIRTSHG